MARKRQPGITPEITEAICIHLRNGNFREVACRAACVAKRTFDEWLSRGRKATKGPYFDLLQAVLKAEQDAEIKMVRRVLAASRKDAKHAEWWLERKVPERWGSDKLLVKQLERRIAELEKVADREAIHTRPEAPLDSPDGQRTPPPDGPAPGPAGAEPPPGPTPGPPEPPAAGSA